MFLPELQQVDTTEQREMEPARSPARPARASLPVIGLTYLAGSLFGNFSPSEWITYADDLAAIQLIIHWPVVLIVQLIAMAAAVWSRFDSRLALVWLCALSGSHYVGAVTTATRFTLVQDTQTPDCELAPYMLDDADTPATDTVTRLELKQSVLPLGLCLVRFHFSSGASNTDQVESLATFHRGNEKSNKFIDALCYQHSANHPGDIFTDLILPIVTTPWGSPAYIEKRDVHGDSLRLARLGTDGSFTSMSLGHLLMPILTSLIPIFLSYSHRTRRKPLAIAFLAWSVWCWAFTPWIAWII